MTVSLEELKKQSENGGIEVGNVVVEDQEAVWELIISNGFKLKDDDGELDFYETAINRNIQIKGKPFIKYFIEGGKLIGGKNSWIFMLERIDVSGLRNYGMIIEEDVANAIDKYLAVKKARPVDQITFETILELWETNLPIALKKELLEIKDEKQNTAFDYVVMKGKVGAIELIYEQSGDWLGRMLWQQREKILPSAVVGGNDTVKSVLNHIIRPAKSEQVVSKYKSSTLMDVFFDMAYNFQETFVKSFIPTALVNRVYSSKGKQQSEEVDIIKNAVKKWWLGERLEQVMSANKLQDILVSMSEIEARHLFVSTGFFLNSKIDLKEIPVDQVTKVSQLMLEVLKEQNPSKREKVLDKAVGVVVQEMNRIDAIKIAGLAR